MSVDVFLTVNVFKLPTYAFACIKAIGYIVENDECAVDELHSNLYKLVLTFVSVSFSYTGWGNDEAFSEYFLCNKFKRFKCTPSRTLAWRFVYAHRLQWSGPVSGSFAIRSRCTRQCRSFKSRRPSSFRYILALSRHENLWLPSSLNM